MAISSKTCNSSTEKLQHSDCTCSPRLPAKSESGSVQSVALIAVGPICALAVMTRTRLFSLIRTLRYMLGPAGGICELTMKAEWCPPRSYPF